MAFSLDNLDSVCSHLARRMEANPQFRKRATEMGKSYVGHRGTMVVDVIGSRQRKYTSYVKPKIIQRYANERDGSLKDLAANPPTFLRLRKDEVPGMSRVAQVLLDYGKKAKLSDEEEICSRWALLPSIHDSGGAHAAVQNVIDVKGIGPALLEYLRMLCGADTIKVDVRVLKQLSEAGVPVGLFKDAGIYEVCRAVAKELNISLVELDSLLWLNDD